MYCTARLSIAPYRRKTYHNENNWESEETNLGFLPTAVRNNASELINTLVDVSPTTALDFFLMMVGNT